MGTFTNSEYPDEKDLPTKFTICFENYNLTPLDVYNGLSQV